MKVYKKLPEKYEADVFRMLCDADVEFVPKLSVRTSSSQHNLKEYVKEEKPYSYFKMMKEQNFIIEIQNDRVVGFMTYKSSYSISDAEGFDISDYITTVIVDKRFRGKGITYRLYDFLFKTLSASGRKHVTTRTWSTNSSHIHILENKGFKVIKMLEDDRGEGIDTVYYGKKL